MTRLFIEASRVDKSSRQPQRDMSYAAIRSIAEAKPAPAAARLPRGYLKTPNAPGQRAFLRCAASFFLEIRQYSCEKMSCATQKSLAAGHIMSFQIHPNDLPAFMQQQIDDIRLIQERYAWFLDGIFAGKSFEKKKGQRKTSLAQQIEKKGLEPFVSGVSLGADSKVDAPKVNAQFCIRGTGREAEVVEKMYFDRLLDFVYAEFMKGLQKGFVPKRCANCGRWFLQAPGATFAYCAGPAPEDPGKTCREIGASSSFRSKAENNDVWKVHQRAYKKYFARIRSGLMTKGEFEVWSRQAADLRDAALERYAQAKSEDERQRIAQEVAEALNEE